MEKCNDTWNGQDKRKHFLVCFVISIVNPIIALLAAIGKEIYDAIQPNNHFCWKDILFDVAGLICGSVIHVIILLLIC